MGDWSSAFVSYIDKYSRPEFVSFAQLFLFPPPSRCPYVSTLTEPRYPCDVKGRGRQVLPAAQRGALCPVDHPYRGPLLLRLCILLHS
eukprot:182063-Pyramimonas_sp.AAC.1